MKKEVKQIVTAIEKEVQNLLLAKSFAKKEENRVNEYINPIFNKYNFIDFRTNEKICDQEQLYRSNQEDEIQRFFKECDEAHRQNGFNGGFGCCPALIAKNEINTAEKNLIDKAEKFFNTSHQDLVCFGMNTYHKYVDLLVNLVLSYKKNN